MKTVFITSFHTFVSRAILCTGILDKIAKNKQVKFVIFVPQYKKSYYQSNFGSKNVIIEGININLITKSKLNRFFLKLSVVANSSDNLKIRLKEGLLEDKNYFNYYIISLLRNILSRIKFFPNLIRFFDFHLCKKNNFDKYFKRYEPSLVFSTDLFMNEDVSIMRNAKKRKIKVIGMVRSWDNPTTRGICRIIPDGIVVHNENIKNEMVHLHGISPKDIFISGVPHFDNFFKFEPDSRINFFKKISADPSKRLIMFSPAGHKFSDSDWQIAHILKKAQDKNLIPKDVQFLIRFHPTNYVDKGKFPKDSNFILEIPGSDFNDGGYKNRELNCSDNDHLGNSIYFSDLVLNVLSSIGIEAAIFNKPQIMIGFDGFNKKDYLKSVSRFHDDDHMVKFIETKGVVVAKTIDNFLSQINNCLDNPDKNKDGRLRIVKEQCYYDDGGSSDRLANYISKYL